MKIVIDRNTPFVEGVFEPYADVKYIDGKDIAPDDICDADALIIRTRARCSAELLASSPVRMIASASIDTDHIDMEYCSAKGIFVSKSDGSLSGGVANYVFSALYGLASRRSLDITGATIGIVGAGKTGERVAEFAQTLGFRVLKCDPVRAEAESDTRFCTLESLLNESQIVTMHVPLTSSTRGMCDAEFFVRMRPGAIFINASHGEIMDESALIAARAKLGAIIVDTWATEPDVNRELLRVADIATPHISGYSYQGKQRGTAMAVRSVARFFGITPLFEFFPKAEMEELEAVKLSVKNRTQGEIASLFQYNYPVFTDDFLFRLNPGDFERIRGEYKYRREFFLE